MSHGRTNSFLEAAIKANVLKLFGNTRATYAVLLKHPDRLSGQTARSSASPIRNNRPAQGASTPKVVEPTAPPIVPVAPEPEPPPPPPPPPLVTAAAVPRAREVVLAEMAGFMEAFAASLLADARRLRSLLVELKDIKDPPTP